MKNALIISCLIFFSFVLATNAQEVDKEFQVVPMEQVDLVKAKQIINNTCLTCHSAKATMQDRMAPPLEAVKRHYLQVYPEIEDFTKALTAFATNPTEDKALLRGAVRRFGVMPQQGFSEEDILAVATYIYQFELEKPEWFDDHFQQMQKRQNKGQTNQLEEGAREHCERGHCKNGKGKRQGQQQKD